jgi:transcription antitermination factor NusG
MYKLSKQEVEFREKMRGRYPVDPKWYAVMTHCGHEHAIRDRILSDFANDGVKEVFLPELKANVRGHNGNRKRPELLFSCYAFLHCRMSDELYMTVGAYDASYGILGQAYRIPSSIEEKEMIHLKGILASYPAPLLSPRLNVGAEAVVTAGLMQGMPGRVVEFNSHFVKLEACFSFFDNGTSIIVSVPLNQIRLGETGLFSSPRLVAAERI